jgi:t-SNARE complex subunit (syntaxin)
MNKLEEWFKEDCPNEPEHHFKTYEKDYNRAQLEYRKEQLEDLKRQLENIKFKANQDYINYKISTLRGEQNDY